MTAERKLEFLTYSVYREQKLITVSDLVKQHGFMTVPFAFVGDGALHETIQDIFVANREAYSFETDGIVFKQGDRAIAFKFSNEDAVTTLTDIEWNLSRTGRLVPKAIFKPIKLAGANVSQATLNNARQVIDMKLAVGDQILVSRRNDVIPCVEEIVEKGTGESWIPSEHNGQDLVLEGVHLVVEGFDKTEDSLYYDCWQFFVQCEPYGFGETLFKKLHGKVLHGRFPRLLDSRSFEHFTTIVRNASKLSRWWVRFTDNGS